MCPATQYWQRTLANTVGKLVTEYVIFNLYLVCLLFSNRSGFNRLIALLADTV